jgi:hypothetical protein
MIKAAIIACALCAGAGGTAFWVKSAGSSSGQGLVVSAGDLMSIQELRSKAHTENLPVTVVPEPY